MALRASDFREIMNKVVSEFVGTMLLVITIILAVGSGTGNAARKFHHSRCHDSVQLTS